TKVRRQLPSYDRIYSADLLEAELRATFHREHVEWEPALVSAIGFVLPDRRLSVEIARTLEAGYLRGADLWHVACALYLREALGELDFLTLHGDQRKVALAAGLEAPA